MFPRPRRDVQGALSHSRVRFGQHDSVTARTLAATWAAKTTRLGTGRRLLGVDAARGVALLGMMSVHIIPRTEAGEITTAYEIAAGRSAALFATLAGVGLALASGRQTPLTGAALSGARRATFGRALVLLFVGLALGGLHPPVAVILAYYAVLFVVAIPLLGLRAPALAAIAVTCALVTPQLSYVLRQGLELPSPANPDLTSLTEPVDLLVTIVVTGYYPVLTWTTYLCAGLAVGRLALGSARIAAWLLGGGLLLAGASKVISAVLLDAGGRDAIEAAGAQGSWVQGIPLDNLLEGGLYGTTPTTSPAWLLISAPHSGTTFDLMHTTGTSLAVLGAALLLTQHAGRIVALLLYPLAAAGSMTLTLYTVHVIAVDAAVGPADPYDLYLLHAVLALVVATVWRTVVGRGPLEALAARVAAIFRGS